MKGESAERKYTCIYFLGHMAKRHMTVIRQETADGALS